LNVARSAPGNGSGLHRLAGVNTKALAAIGDVNGNLLSGFTDLTKEWTDFASRRLHEDLEFASRLAKCTSPHDVFAVCADFYYKACDAYRQEMAVLLKLGQAIAGNAVNGGTRQMAQAVHAAK
jgi:hypothetical protein